MTDKKSEIMQLALKKSKAEDRKAEEADLWQLLALQTRKFTSDDSSSVPSEVAEELLKSALFVIKQGKVRNGTVLELFESGTKIIQKKVRVGKAMFQMAYQSRLSVDCALYHSTLSALALFFRNYDLRFFAHKVPAILDYQLCIKTSDKLLGVLYVNDYLRSLCIENEFCGRFEQGRSAALLKAVDGGADDFVGNIYEPIATNALALTLLGKDAKMLSVSEEDRAVLCGYFEQWSADKLADELLKASTLLLHILGISDPAAYEYLARVAKATKRRILICVKAGSLENLFFTL